MATNDDSQDSNGRPFNKQAARDFSKGFQEPQTFSDGLNNIKNEVSSFFGGSQDDAQKAMKRRLDSQSQ